jgi:hypothetical protein
VAQSSPGSESRAAQRVKVEAFVKVVGEDKEFVFRTAKIIINNAKSLRNAQSIAAWKGRSCGD